MRRHIPLDLQDFVNDALKTELRKSVDVLGVRLSEWRTSIDTSLRIPIQHPHASADPQNCFGTSCREERHPTPAPCGDIPHWLRRICWNPAAGQNLGIFSALSGAGHRGTPPSLRLAVEDLQLSAEQRNTLGASSREGRHPTRGRCHWRLPPVRCPPPGTIWIQRYDQHRRISDPWNAMRRHPQRNFRDSRVLAGTASAVRASSGQNEL